MSTTEKFLSPENLVLTDLGPCLHARGVTYRVWAKGHHAILIHVERPDGTSSDLPLEQAKESGYFFGLDPAGKAGDLYTVSIDGGPPLPDFVSHYQPKGVFGPSMIIDAQTFAWQATEWQRPAWSGQVVYECHVGTFTKEGTFRSAIERLDYLVDLGITAIEIMPVAQWSGERNWGYDGVLLFAPAHCYGTPDDFRELIDACHLRGLAVILDIVYNHLGPEGNFSHQYSQYFFHEGKGNPWGQNFNLDGPNSEPVRALLRQNIRSWLQEFRIDGFRMDATQAVHDSSPVHLLAEIAEIVHRHGGFIIAEDDRNSRVLLEPLEKNGWNFNALWSDDFHHAMRVTQTKEQQHFLRMFKGHTQEIGEILRKGWYYTGQFSEFHQILRGTLADDFPPESFVFCISNHDQVGNRIQGVRFHENLQPSAYRAVSLFLCLVPYTPLFFMGQEWGAGTPFHYFTDMSEELGAKITEGRKREYLEHGIAADPAELADILGPQEEKTFLHSKLNWSEHAEEQPKRLIALHQAGLRLRKELFAGTNPPRDQWTVEVAESSVTIRYRLPDRNVSVHLRLKSGLSSGAEKVLLSSNGPTFSTDAVEVPETVVILDE